MFNLYQHLKANAEGRDRESETTGHDRFYQERSRSSYRKKKKRVACRRAQSAAELNPQSIAAAQKRNAFKMRSVSTDRDESEEENSERTPLVAQKIDSLAKLLFNKSLIGGSGKSSPSEPTSSPKTVEASFESSVALAICSEYLSQTSRYELKTQLGAIGSRPYKHWFIISDNSTKTDRLLSLVPLSSKCPLEGSEHCRRLTGELFRALHHPYVLPALDMRLASGHALTITPLNPRGTLKDLIYKSTWNEEYCKKYNQAGVGLPAWQVATFGRQILEGLLFLKDKGFPPFRHLHTGNVVVQNGVARISGLENTLTGAAPRCPLLAAAPERAEVLSLGHVLFEMCAARDTDMALLDELAPIYPHAVELIEHIWGARAPALHELLVCELFRKIDLREMKGSCLPNFSQRLSRSCLSLLGEVARRQTGQGAAGQGTPGQGAPGQWAPGQGAPGQSRTRSGPGSPLTPPPRRRHVPLEQDFTEVWEW